MFRPNRPKRLLILGQVFKVMFVKVGSPILDDHDAVGRVRRTSQEVYVEEDQGPDQERETILHEVLHACTIMQNIIPDRDEDERIVNAIAPVLLDVLRKNPGIVEYLVGRSFS